MNRTQLVSNQDYAHELGAFCRQQPGYNHQALKQLQQQEFARLDAGAHVYLDYTGAALYPQSLVMAHQSLLLEGVFGNPHSENPTAHHSSVLLDKARRQVLDYFHADPAEYCCVFTANASASLKTVGECYSFGDDGFFLYGCDNHNSVLGIREFARHKGAGIDSLPLLRDSCTIDEHDLDEKLARYAGHKNKLLAFPAQSNYSGIKHSLAYIRKAQDLGWDVLLDAAAYVPSSTLDLSDPDCKPEYVCVSFYKMFGYPAGIGCLLIKIRSVKEGALTAFRKLWMNKQYFCGGTVEDILCSSDGKGQYHLLHSDYQAFEDGTVNYLGIPAVCAGLDMLSGRKEGLELYSVQETGQRIKWLMDWLTDALCGLSHTTGHKLISVCGEEEKQRRGGTIFIKLSDNEGKEYSCSMLEDILAWYNGQPGNAKISVRIGAFCNPGSDQFQSGLNIHEKNERLQQKIHDAQSGMYREKSKRQPMDVSKSNCNDQGHFPGGMRISMGMSTCFDDAYVFLDFARSFLHKSQADFLAEIKPYFEGLKQMPA